MEPTMRDIEANEGSGGEDQGLINRDESGVQIELKNRTEKSSVGNTVDTEGNTALHDAVLSVCQEGNMHADGYTYIVELMNKEDIELNRPNNKGNTAIGCAVELDNKTCVEHMLRHPLSHRLYLDYYPGERESTVRELIMLMYPDLQPLLPAPLLANRYAQEVNTKLLVALQQGDEETFKKNLSPTNPNPRYDEPYHSTLLEIASQMKNRTQFVTLLLDHGADPNTMNIITGMPLLHATARSGNFEVLEILLKRGGVDVGLKDNKERTLFHWLALVSERAEGDKERIEKCFKSLLQLQPDPRAGIEMRDSSGKSALSIALEREFRDRIIILLDTQPHVRDSEHIDPILTSARLPLLEDILDYCIETNNVPNNSIELKVTFRHWVLTRMVSFSLNARRNELMRHPVVSMFLHMAWKNVLNFTVAEFCLYALLLYLLTLFMLLGSFNSTNDEGVTNNTNGLLSSKDSYTTSATDKERIYSLIFPYCINTLLVLLLIKVLFQASVYGIQYIQSLENCLELLLLFVTFTSCSGIVGNVEVRRHCFAITIFMVWLQFLFVLGRQPQFSVHTEMLKTVSMTFLRFMAGYTVLLLAFAFCFYTIFKGNVEVGMFGHPLKSVMRTIVMFSGEFDSSDIPFDTLPGTSHVIFLLFVLFVAIVLLNLLNGLAVDDASKIREEAEKLSLEARVRLLAMFLYMSYGLPNSIKKIFKVTEQSYVLYPNDPDLIASQKMKSTHIPNLLLIITKRKEGDKREKSAVHIENWEIAEKLSALQSQSDEMRQILMRLLTHLKVPES